VAARPDVQVRLRDWGDVLPPAVRIALLQRAATHAIGIIRRRTAQGLDVEGNAFKSYSTKYAEKRAQSGRNTNPVDLTLGGDMLAAMVVLEVTPERALIGFQGSSTPYAFVRFRTAKGKVSTRRVKNANGTSVQIKYTLKRYSGHHSTAELAQATLTGRKLAKHAPVANAVKAKAHNDGSGRLPRRHFFGLSETERREVLDEAARTLRIRK
jgi:phage gpG-like protein